MLHAHCDVINIGNEVYFKPRESHSINYNCLANRQHTTYDYHIGQIFDIRKFLVNNTFTGDLHLYAVFYDEDRSTPDLSDLVSVSTINLFDRYKTKNHGIKMLEYKCYSNFTFDCQPLRNKDTYLVYLGNAHEQNFREIAYENPGCFTQTVSSTGNGYLSINMIVNKPLKNKYALLLGFTKRILDDERHNIPEAVAISIEDTIPMTNIDNRFSENDLTNMPTAPAYIYEPSAPPIPPQNITML